MHQRCRHTSQASLGSSYVSQEGSAVPSAQSLYHGVLYTHHGCCGGGANPKTVPYKLVRRDSHRLQNVSYLAHKDWFRQYLTCCIQEKGALSGTSTAHILRQCRDRANIHTSDSNNGICTLSKPVTFRRFQVDLNHAGISPVVNCHITPGQIHGCIEG